MYLYSTVITKNRCVNIKNRVCKYQLPWLACKISCVVDLYFSNTKNTKLGPVFLVFYLVYHIVKLNYIFIRLGPVGGLIVAYIWKFDDER